MRRLRRLEQASVIRQYVTLVDPHRITLGLLAYVKVKLEQRGQMPRGEFSRTRAPWTQFVTVEAAPVTVL